MDKHSGRPHWGSDPFTFPGIPCPTIPSEYPSPFLKNNEKSEAEGLDEFQLPRRSATRQLSVLSWGTNQETGVIVESPMEIDNDFDDSPVPEDHHQSSKENVGTRNKLYPDLEELGSLTEGYLKGPQLRNSGNRRQRPISYADVAQRNIGGDGGYPNYGNFPRRNSFEEQNPAFMQKPSLSLNSTSSLNFGNSQFRQTRGAGRNVRYESESEEESTPSLFSISGAKNFLTSKIGSPSSWLNPTTKPKRQPYLLTNMKQLYSLSLGTWEMVHLTQKLHLTLTSYVKNSSGVKPYDVQVHGIMQLMSEATSEFSSSTGTLLWLKTTSGSVQHLQNSTPGNIAFYDRVARALSRRPNDKGPHRQILLLCSVILGKEFETEHGYQHWAKLGIPAGFDSIKAKGKQFPNPKENQLHASMIIPCGKTESKKIKGDLEYNEYIVFGLNRVCVRYAVDLEIKK